MAVDSTFCRFRLQLSDVTRGVYEKLELRLARHPSEDASHLVSRVLAYALNYQPGIEFTQGLATPDDPAVWIKDPTGNITLWIEIGNPTARRLHKASKTAKVVRVYTYRDPEILKKEVSGQEVFRKEQIEFFSLNTKFIDSVGEQLAAQNGWDVLRDEDELSVTVGEHSFSSTLVSHQLS